MKSLQYVIAVMIAGGIGVGPAQEARGAGLEECPAHGVISKDCQLTAHRTSKLGVAANGVTVECNFFRIGGTADRQSGNGITVAYREDVVLRNCEVAGFDKGIAVTDSTNIQIRDPNIHDNKIGIEIRRTKGRVLVERTLDHPRTAIWRNTLFGVDARFAEIVTLRGTHFAPLVIGFNEKFGARLSEIKLLTVQSVHFEDNPENHLTYVWGSQTPPTPQEGGSPVIRHNKFIGSQVAMNIFTGHQQLVRLDNNNTCEDIQDVDIQFFMQRPPPKVTESPEACHIIRAIPD